jgi:hypothetical protein
MIQAIPVTGQVYEAMSKLIALADGSAVADAEAGARALERSRKLAESVKDRLAQNEKLAATEKQVAAALSASAASAKQYEQALAKLRANPNLSPAEALGQTNPLAGEVDRLQKERQKLSEGFDDAPGLTRQKQHRETLANLQKEIDSRGKVLKVLVATGHAFDDMAASFAKQITELAKRRDEAQRAVDGDNKRTNQLGAIETEIKKVTALGETWAEAVAKREKAEKHADAMRKEREAHEARLAQLRQDRVQAEAAMAQSVISAGRKPMDDYLDAIERANQAMELGLVTRRQFDAATKAARLDLAGSLSSGPTRAPATVQRFTGGTPGNDRRNEGLDQLIKVAKEQRDLQRKTEQHTKDSVNIMRDGGFIEVTEYSMPNG